MTQSSVQYALMISSKRPSIDSGPLVGQIVSTSTPIARAAATAELRIVSVIAPEGFGLTTSRRVMSGQRLVSVAEIPAHVARLLGACEAKRRRAELDTRIHD